MFLNSTTKGAAMDTIHLLMQFGLTHQEAKLYISLYHGGQATGYELAKASGVSRSNAYAGLSSLVEKGGAWVVDGKPVCYQAVPPEEFCGNVIRGLQRTKEELARELPNMEPEEEGYLTIRGERNIRDKIENMIRATQKHIYLSMRTGLLEEFLPSLRELAGKGAKVVLICEREVDLAGAIVYRNPEQAEAIRVICDTRSALTGSLDDSPGCSCLHSNKENLVHLLRDSMSNEIKVIKITGGNAK